MQSEQRKTFCCGYCQNHCAAVYILEDRKIIHMQGHLCPNGMMELLKELLQKNCF